MLDQLGDLAGKTVTADALLTQTAIASYLRKHDAHYMFVAKDNQKTLLNDIRLWFHDDAKRPPDFAHTTGKPINGKLPTAHGRWEQREIWTTTALNDYLLFPGVGQAFLIRRTRCQVRKGRVTDTSVDTSWGVTSHTPHTADAQRLLRINRGHWTIENSLHRILDDSDNWNEDNSRIRTGHGPENMTGLRRFAIGVIKMHGKPVAATVRKLHRTPRLLLDYLKMSANTRPSPPSPDTDAAAHDDNPNSTRPQGKRLAGTIPVPGTPRHKSKNPRKPRPHVGRRHHLASSMLTTNTRPVPCSSQTPPAAKQKSALAGDVTTSRRGRVSDHAPPVRPACRDSAPHPVKYFNPDSTSRMRRRRRKGLRRSCKPEQAESAQRHPMQRVA